MIIIIIIKTVYSQSNLNRWQHHVILINPSPISPCIILISLWFRFVTSIYIMKTLSFSYRITCSFTKLLAVSTSEMFASAWFIYFSLCTLFTFIRQYVLHLNFAIKTFYNGFRKLFLFFIQ